MKKLLKNKMWQAFILSFILGCLIIVPNIILGGHGIYTLRDDFDYQQIPFGMMINHSLKTGNILWTWFNELASNFIGTFSFYNLFSPFNLISYLFPAKIYPYIIGPIFILKYAVAGLTSFLFLKRYVKNKNYALIGSLLYAFSGFQLTNILFYHFHDIVAFFPLVLYTFDNLLYDNKKLWFSLSIFLIAITNWFFLIGIIVFLVIYYFIKIIFKEIKFNFKKFIYIALEGALGLGLAAVVLIPSYLFTVGNPRINNNWQMQTALKYPLIYYLEIIRGMIFPPQAMYPRAFITRSNYASVELYLPVVGMILVFSYWLKKPKNWLSILSYVLIIMMFIPILNSSYFLFTTYYYARWFYIPILIFVLISIKTLDAKLYNYKGLIFNIGLISLFLFLLKYLKYDYILNKNFVIYSILVTIISNIIMIVLLNIKKEKKKIITLIITISIYVVIWGNYLPYVYKNNTFKIDDKYLTYLKSDKSLDFNQQAVRTNRSNSCSVNTSFIEYINNINNFNSNINSSSFKFYHSLGIYRDVSTKIDFKNYALNDILGVQYILSCNNRDINDDHYKLAFKTTKFKIYENPDYKVLGYFVDDYIKTEDFNLLSNEEKINTLLNKVVLNQKQINKYKELFNQKNEYLDYNIKFIKNGLEANINSKNETLAIFAIPFDEGWTITLNNKIVDFEEVNNGFIGIKLNKGQNKIKFKYFTPGLKVGIVVSLISLVGVILIIIIKK